MTFVSGCRVTNVRARSSSRMFRAIRRARSKSPSSARRMAAWGLSPNRMASADGELRRARDDARHLHALPPELPLRADGRLADRAALPAPAGGCCFAAAFDRRCRAQSKLFIVTFRREGAAQGPVCLRGLGDELVRYDIDYLTDNGVYCLRCFRVGFFHTRVGYPKPSRKATLNRILQIANGMIVNSKRNVEQWKCRLQTTFLPVYIS